MAETIQIRDAVPADFKTVLRLNQAFVHFLSPLDLNLLAALGGEAAYFRVAEMDGDVVAFLIALTPGASYASQNYLWFDTRFDGFAYIDRIVVAERAQGNAVGARLYDDLAAFAKGQGLKQLTCEYNIEPMNEGSAIFHDRYGFKEVGQQDLPELQKCVSMQVYALTE